MARLSPQVLVQLTRRTVRQQFKWKPTAQHAELEVLVPEDLSSRVA